jgi:hypothetical protein
MKICVLIAALAFTLTATGCSTSEEVSQEEIEQFDQFLSSVRVDGSEVDQPMADRWFNDVYVESNCPAKDDPTQDCETTELLASESVFVPEGFDFEIAAIGPNEDGEVKWSRRSFVAPQSMSLWCFKIRSFTRENTELKGEPLRIEFEDFDYPCYLLTDDYNDGVLQSTYFGTLLETGLPGVRPEDECRIKFGRNGEQDLPEQYDKCLEENEWTAAPTW